MTSKGSITPAMLRNGEGKQLVELCSRISVITLRSIVEPRTPVLANHNAIGVRLEKVSRQQLLYAREQRSPVQRLPRELKIRKT